MEESIPYYDYAFKWFDFAIKYNSAFLVANSKAFETFLSAKNGTAQNIEKTIRSSFDTTLRNDLYDDVFATSMIAQRSLVVSNYIAMLCLSILKQNSIFTKKVLY